MSENPFQSPASDFAVGVKSGRREDLKSIATYQKGILVCILIYLLTIVGNFFIPEDVQILLGLALAVLGVVSTVFVFLLAIKVYNTGVGILLGTIGPGSLPGIDCVARHQWQGDQDSATERS